MGWTYKESTKHTSRPAASLAGYASLLYAARKHVCALSPYVFMTDPARVQDVVQAARTIPMGSALIYRHFGAEDAREIALELRGLCSARGIQFLIAADIALAVDVGADGVHFPEKLLMQAKTCRESNPHFILTGAAHSPAALERCALAGLDAALLSPVFTSNSPSAGDALGAPVFARWAEQARLPVFALGGVTMDTAAQLLQSPCAGIAGVAAFAMGGVQCLEKEAAAAMSVLHAQGFEHGWPEADFTAHMDNPSDDVLGVWEGECLAGFVIVRTQDDQSEILTVVVDKTKQGQGYGAALLLAGQMCSLNRGADIMFLEVAKDNMAGIRLYEQQGYVRCGVRRGYYRRAMGRVDAILFQRKLAPLERV